MMQKNAKFALIESDEESSLSIKPKKRKKKEKKKKEKEKDDSDVDEFERMETERWEMIERKTVTQKMCTRVPDP